MKIYKVKWNEIEITTVSYLSGTRVEQKPKEKAFLNKEMAQKHLDKIRLASEIVGVPNLVQAHLEKMEVDE